jgi:hypothetical protein
VFYLLGVFKATTSDLSYQQLVSELSSSENRKVFGIYLIFQSCQKHLLIIPSCRVHPYKLTNAKLSIIGAGGIPHALLESLPLYPTRIRRAPRKKTTELHASRAKRIFPKIFLFQPQRTARRPESVSWSVQPISDPFSTK